MKYLILALLLLSTSARGADLSGDFKGPLGLQLYTLRESFKTNVPATLDKVKALGFTEIEGGGDYGLGIEKFIPTVMNSACSRREAPGLTSLCSQRKRTRSLSASRWMFSG